MTIDETEQESIIERIFVLSRKSSQSANYLSKRAYPSKIQVTNHQKVLRTQNDEINFNKQITL